MKRETEYRLFCGGTFCFDYRVGEYEAMAENLLYI